jgi:SAM-dependent methyltransferase
MPGAQPRIGGAYDAEVAVLERVVERLTNPARFRIVPSGSGTVIDIGCGSSKFPGAVGLDVSGDTDADIVHDLDTFPYPIEDDSFDQLLLQDVIEHVSEPIRVFEELHRIGRTGARVQVRTPHFSSALAYGDPTHRHYLGVLAMRSLAEPRFAHYTTVRFRLLSVRLDLWLPYRALGLELFANHFPDIYERYFAFIFPTMNIHAEYEVVK